MILVTTGPPVFWGDHCDEHHLERRRPGARRRGRGGRRPDGGPGPAPLVAFGWGAALLGVAAVIVLVLIRAGKEDMPTGAPTHPG